MTTDLPDPIDLPERVHGPVRPADVPDGWEWKYALYDPHIEDDGLWYTGPGLPSTYMVWVREPEPATIEIDADLALRLANDASWSQGGKQRTTAAERAILRAAAKRATK